MIERLGVDGEPFVTLYHRTTCEAAGRIVLDGFRDAEGDYGMCDEGGSPITLRGIWLSDRPLTEQDGVRGETLLAVFLCASEAELAEYEVVEEGKAYREWFIPAELLNTLGSVREVDEGEPEKVSGLGWTCAMCELDFPASEPRFPFPDLLTGEAEPPCPMHGVYHGRPCPDGEGYGYSDVVCGSCLGQMKE